MDEKNTAGEANRQALIDRAHQYGVGSGPLKVVMTEREIVALVEALRGMLEDDGGGCDHSVGICACGVIWFIQAIDHAQGRHEGKSNPYECGPCADSERLLKTAPIPTDCDCESGYFSSGVPGILAHVVGHEIRSRVERCDLCCLYETDADAGNALVLKLQLGGEGETK